MALTSALMEWSRFHQWALGTLTDAVVYLNGGIDAVMSSNPPKALLIYLTPRRHIEGDKNPANAFDVEQSFIATIGEHPLLRNKEYEDLQEQCKLLEEMVHVDGHYDDPTFVGILPGVFAITDTSILLYQRFPVYRLPVQHVKDDPRDEWTHGAMESLVDMMMAAMTTGVVFKRSENRAHEEPEIGGVVRSKKMWRGDGRLIDWDGFNAIIGRELAVGVGLTPAKILTVLRKLALAGDGGDERDHLLLREIRDGHGVHSGDGRR
ncbi:hypothetical protein GSI_07301 [Ganoderma sinense ZZ0214-1]|uniref:Uncharacterized protein n=1 Tax=Ganoderma sinense ZZ0214-1 TaxID=1077348 RepID=A0A2G8SA15_9APHY|nr:hypothetical protein GSI_07301 [Ganoderma sinense ZZ0214-1]